MREYSENHCWQYDIRTKNLTEDLLNSNLTEEETKTLRVKDFVFANEPKETVFQEVKEFIEQHEWLGKVGLYPTHFFTARYKGRLAGVVVMDMPNAFSKLLGDNTRKIERLISRGACISWSPKNLASALIMWSIKWMAQNTNYRLFTAYSDVEAKELGTIYQACGFFYLGKHSGAKFNFKIENGKWVSDRYFRSRSVYKRIAKKNNVKWIAEWQKGDRIIWEKVPTEVEEILRNGSKEYEKSCEKRIVPPKHKYAFILGKSTKETQALRKEFLKLNKIKSYPKTRGE